MKQKKKTISRVVLFTIMMVYLEVVFQLLIYGSATWGMLFGALFALPAAFLFTLLTGLGPERLNRVLTTLLMIVIEVLFNAQLVYYEIFHTYMQVFSIINGAGNAVEFSSVIWDCLVHVWWKILILLIPLIACFCWFFRKDKYVFVKNGWKMNLISAAAAVVSYFVILLVLSMAGKGMYDPYSIYHDRPILQLSVKNLGVLTTMRRDAQRLFFGGGHSSLGLSGYSAEESSAEDTSNAETAEEGSSSAEEKNVLVPQPNVLDIDFQKLAASESNETIAQMHQYFAQQKPTYTNEYTGMFEGYNLILITAESFSGWVIDEQRTPTLYKMANSGFVFNNFYTPLFSVSTSDGEYVTHTSLLPKSDVWSYYRSSMIEMPFGFGNLFSGLGYSCRGYHDHNYDYYGRDLSHPNMGYIWKGYGNGLYVDYTWPESDVQMMEFTIPEYIGDEPFHTYYLTVSGHMLYNFTGSDAMADKWADLVQDLPYDEATRAYLAGQVELDRAMEYLLDQLEAAGVADHTVIALTADHYPYGLTVEELSELDGSDLTEDFEIYKNKFILYCPGIEETVYVDKLGCNLDAMPTLANLFNLPFDSRLCMGSDILSDAEGMVIMNNYSFFTEKVLYNSETGEVKFFDQEYPQSYVDERIAKVNDKFTISAAVLDNNYYSYLTEYLPWWDGESYGHLYDPETEDPPAAEESSEGVIE